MIIDKEYRGNGIGKELIDTITNDDRLENMSGMLLILNAHGLYEQFGFCKVENKFMRRD